tara:strand:+ start:4194 stop:5282 length:1089 start_codon:yes stop_codon:yes gene_type:complete
MTTEVLLGNLIEYHTENPGGDELALCEFLCRELRARGADEVTITQVPRAKGSEVGAYVFARFGSPQLLINVHIDTVPANTGWTQDPWIPSITADKVIGLGAADTKGAIAAILTVLETIVPHNVGLLFSGDEEHGTSCIRAFLTTARAQGIERALVCEPTNRYVGVRHRGVSGYHANFQGQGGHSSNADCMPKPITILARLAVELDDLGQRYVSHGPDDMKGICMNVAVLEGGVSFNVVPDAATLTWSIRPPHGFDQDTFDQEIKVAIENINPAITLTRQLHNPPFSTIHLAPFEQMLESHIQGFVPLQFWTEAAILSDAGINAVVIGPGNIAQAHGADEWVSRDDLKWAVTLFTHIFKDTLQ